MDATQLELDLNSFRVTQTQYTNGLETLLKNFLALIQDHQRLQSDYEEARDSREKYKKIVKEADRNPFVLVLIDGDGYLFQDHFVRARGDGGVEAAQELHKQINTHLATLGGEAARSRIMVRIYANLKGLSQTLARHGLSGNESRSMGPFVSSFTRAQELFDFIDAGEKKEGADFKIRETFRLFIESAQCKHVFFAGCHDTGYLSMLTPYIKSANDRISLIRGTAFHQDFAILGFAILPLPTIFRSSPLVDISYANLAKEVAKPQIAPKTPNTRMDFAKPNTTKRPCSFYQKGQCTFGKNCRNQHETGTDESRDVTSALTWRVNAPASPTKAKSWRPLSSSLSGTDENGSHKDMIPINSAGDRVDLPLPSTSPTDFEEYAARINDKKVCNDHVLAQACDKEDCVYDHGDVAPNVVNVLRGVVRNKLKCPKRGECRSRLCYRAHTKFMSFQEGDEEESITWVDAED